MTAETSAEEAINALLTRYKRFGVDLGLDRIETLLAALGNPQQHVPIIHVAGTNGKGSVCACLSSVLTQAGYRVGRYTSPHLVHWNERICISEQPISLDHLLRVLKQVDAAVDADQPSPTQFEIITAAAWLYFAQQSVDVAVIEVGLGGRLDATNVCHHPLVTVITSLSREHWQQLGPTLADIAREKAGILKFGCPAVVGELPPEAKAVVQAKIEELNCLATWPEPARELSNGWAEWEGIQYPLPFPGQHQQMNSAIAIATLLHLRDQGWQIADEAIVSGMSNASWPGRLQWTTWRDAAGVTHPLLIDGAHNPAAAKMLRAYVDRVLTEQGKSGTSVSRSQDIDGSTDSQPTLALMLPEQERGNASVTWLMGMLSTKDHADVFRELLRPGDRLHLVPVPDHYSAELTQLSAIAQEICPNLSHCQTHESLGEGLRAVWSSNSEAPSNALTVLCGSLYLIGHFFTMQAPRVPDK
ncbi:MAG TPA: folylpolyglutamate synthase/dihydrofolate synthase family protein [Leptolyngbyaceae cyanobacterium]